MADSARIGANFSDYEGNAGLGNLGMGVFQIDTRPLQQLAAYTFEYNRVAFQQRQKDLEAQAQEVGEFAKYDLTNAIPKYAKVLRDQYDETFAWIQKNPDAMDYKKNPEKWLEYQKRKNELANNIKDGASQEIINAAFQEAIDKETRPEVIASLEKQRKEQIEANDIKTPIKFQQYGAEPTVLPVVPTKKFDIIRRDANGDMIIDREIDIADQKFINEQASILGLGLQKEILDVNSAEFKALSPDVQKLKIAQNDRAKATGRREIVDRAQVLTEALQQFRDPTTGKIDESKVMASNAIISGSLKAVMDYNQIMRDEKAKIKAGAYSDNLGVLKFGIGGIEEKDYAEIDYTDGEITPVDMLKVELRGKAPVTSYKTEAKELDNRIKRENLAVEWYKAKTGRISAEKTDDKAGVFIDRPALLFGEHIDRLKKHFASHEGESINVPYSRTDEKTRVAAKMDEGDIITYKKDGSYVITGADKVQKSVGTIDNLAQGFINAVKTIDLTQAVDKDGTMAEGFEIKSEDGFRKYFNGNTSGQAIWDNWGEPAKESEQQSKPQTYKIGNKTITESQIEKGAAKYKMSIEEYKRSIGL